MFFDAMEALIHIFIIFFYRKILLLESRMSHMVVEVRQNFEGTQLLMANIVVSIEP